MMAGTSAQPVAAAVDLGIDYKPAVPITENMLTGLTDSQLTNLYCQLLDDIQASKADSSELHPHSATINNSFDVVNGYMEKHGISEAEVD